MKKHVKINNALPRREARHTCADINQAEEMFGFKAKIGLKDGLKMLLREGL